MVAHSSSHSAECRSLPSNLSSPGTLGQFTSFSWPRAVMRTSALSSNVSPVERLVTVTFLCVVSASCPRLLTVRPGDWSLPFPLSSNPLASLDLVTGLDESRGAEFLRHALKIGLDLTAGGVHVAPMWVGREGVLVGVCFLSSVCALSLQDVDLHGISQARPGYLFNHLSNVVSLSTRVS
jgi:hypothetical protein